MRPAIQSFAVSALPVPRRRLRPHIRTTRNTRRESWETLRDVERLSAALLLAQARLIAAASGQWLEAAQAAFRAGGFLHQLPAPGPAEARHQASLAELLAAARLAGQLRVRGLVEKETGEKPDAPLAFAETFPRNVGVDELARYIRSLPVVERSRWEAFVRQHQQAAFTLAGVEREEVLRRLRNLIAQSLEAGLTAEQFDLRARDLLRNYQVDGLRLRLVWNDTIGDAIRAGRREALADPEVRAVLTHGLFDALIDAVVRPNHAALEGAIAPLEWWEGPGNRYQPRLGFSCRCQLIYISAGRARRLLASGPPHFDATLGVPAGAGPDANFVRMV